MRSTVTAPLLNALLPGAGMWYLGRPGRAIANFGLAVLITAVASVFGSEHIHYVLLAIAAGSAGYAHAAAAQDRNGTMVGSA